MPRELKIDRAFYLVDDKTKIYRYLRRNPDREDLAPEENEANKMAIDGYTRVFRSGQTKAYKKSGASMIADHSLNTDVQKRRFALLLRAG